MNPNLPKEIFFSFEIVHSWKRAKRVNARIDPGRQGGKILNYSRWVKEGAYRSSEEGRTPALCPSKDLIYFWEGGGHIKYEENGWDG